MLSATASTPHSTLEILSPPAPTSSDQAPSAVAIEMSRADGVSAVGTIRAAPSRIRTAEEHAQGWRDERCVKATNCTLLLSLTAGAITSITIAGMGASHRGPMYINRDCSMVNVTADSMNTTAHQNGTQLAESCKDSLGMITAVSLSILGSVIMCIMGSLYGSAEACDCMDAHQKSLDGTHYYPDDTPTYSAGSNAVANSGTTHDQALSKPSVEDNRTRVEQQIYYSTYEPYNGGSSHCGGGGG